MRHLLFYTKPFHEQAHEIAHEVQTRKTTTQHLRVREIFCVRRGGACR